MSAAPAAVADISDAKTKEEDVPPIPKRPLTAYNIFSALERHYILQHTSPDTEELLELQSVDQTLDPYYATRPPRYASILLPQNWYVVGKNRKKRQQHKNHGLISFSKLSTMISDAWGDADEQTKAYCKKISMDELDKYREEQKAFKEKYGQEAFDRQTRKRKNAEAAERGEGKKSKSLKKYEKALLAVEGPKQAKGDESQDDKVHRFARPHKKNSPPSRAQSLNGQTDPSPGIQDDGLGQMIRSMQEDRLSRGLALRSSTAAAAAATTLPLSLSISSLQNERLEQLRLESILRQQELAILRALRASDSSHQNQERLEALGLRLGGAAQTERLAQILRVQEGENQKQSAPMSRTENAGIVPNTRLANPSLLSDRPYSGRLQGLANSQDNRSAAAEPSASAAIRDLSSMQNNRLANAGLLSDGLYSGRYQGLTKSQETRSAAAVPFISATIQDLTNPVVLDRIQTIQRIQLQRLALQEQIVQQLLAQNRLSERSTLHETALMRQVTTEELMRLQAEERNAAAALLRLFPDRR